MGIISQEDGKTLARGIQQVQRQQGRKNQHVMFTMHNELDEELFDCMDVWYTECYRELA